MGVERSSTGLGRRSLDMCYRKYVCPFYTEKGLYEACGNCEHLKKAHKSIRNARIGLVVAIVLFIVMTAILGNAYPI